MTLTKSEQKLESHLRGAAILLCSNKSTRDELRSEHLHLFNGKKKIKRNEMTKKQTDNMIYKSPVLIVQIKHVRTEEV